MVFDNFSWVSMDIHNMYTHAIKYPFIVILKYETLSLASRLSRGFRSSLDKNKAHLILFESCFFFSL